MRSVLAICAAALVLAASAGDVESRPSRKAHKWQKAHYKSQKAQKAHKPRLTPEAQKSQDEPDWLVSPPPFETKAPPPHWTSFYFGAHGGFAWGDTDFRAVTGSSPASFGSLSPQGWLGGVQAGYSYEFGNKVVLGFETDFSYAGIDGTAASAGGSALLVESQTEWLGTLRGRIGYAVDKFLPYATGGLAIARNRSHPIGPGGERSHDDMTATGWVAGVGAEYALTDYLTWKAEVLHADFGKSSYLARFPSAGSTIDTEERTTVDSVRFGLNYRLN